ncbi:MAG: 4-(cytidine 5'-diphospho)-2-C-methyl-D-erythritol kinase [Thermodesulfobacteriota bacterium]|nr:4-(cytidine 5'-diphospho)-2-C-methyl-D-erythritol kinase [Thermodesulfobacteriota bacterium]
MELTSYFAPAKVNLCLHVNSSRADGYHELQMVMQKVSLGDKLEIAVSPEPGVRFCCDTMALDSGEENLVVRAARAMLIYDHDHHRGVDIVLTKNIPVAAGLGGGSSDAATTLLALNQQLFLNLDAAQLHAVALSLGADVPFFLYEAVAWACGIGARLHPIKIQPKFWLVLANPGVSVSTAQVYNAIGYDDYSSCSMPDVISTRNELISLLHNDLDGAAIRLCPVIQTITDVLELLGADGTLMTGSGATAFGVFFDEQQAHTACHVLREDYSWWSDVVTPL